MATDSELSSWSARRSRAYRRLGNAVQRIGKRIVNLQSISAIWIDVGAHLGEKTFAHAHDNPSLTVFAFEPTWELARQVMGRLSNFVVFPMAVSAKDGLADFYLNAQDDTSSLLPFDPEGVRRWDGGQFLRPKSKICVPTIRLDTFMNAMDLRTVDYLKIDTQGSDLAVVQSAGSRLRDVRKVTLEVDVTPVRAYQGSAGQAETLAYMQEQGFQLTEVESQTRGQEENLTFVRID